jgi:hypothetical protein
MLTSRGPSDTSRPHKQRRNVAHLGRSLFWRPSGHSKSNKAWRVASASSSVEKTAYACVLMPGIHRLVTVPAMSHLPVQRSLHSTQPMIQTDAVSKTWGYVDQQQLSHFQQSESAEQLVHDVHLDVVHTCTIASPIQA